MVNAPQPLRLYAVGLGFSCPRKRSCVRACHHAGEGLHLPILSNRLGSIRLEGGVPTMDAGKVSRVWVGEKKAAGLIDFVCFCIFLKHPIHSLVPFVRFNRRRS